MHRIVVPEQPRSGTLQAPSVMPAQPAGVNAVASTSKPRERGEELTLDSNPFLRCAWQQFFFTHETVLGSQMEPLRASCNTVAQPPPTRPPSPK